MATISSENPTGNPSLQAANVDEVRAQKNRAAALEFRIEGFTYRQIADALQVSVATAWRYVLAGLDELNAEVEEKAERLRSIEVARLDKMQRALWGKKGDPRAADTLLRIAERRARLMGLDAPNKTEFIVPATTPITAEVKLTDEERAEALRAIVEGRARVAVPPVVPYAEGATNGNGNA